MGRLAITALLVLVAFAALSEAFNYNRAFSGGAQPQPRGGGRNRAQPQPQQYPRGGGRNRAQPQPQQYQGRGNSYNDFFRDDALRQDANYRPHGGLSFGGATGGEGVGISIGGGERPQVSVGMGAAGGGVGADVQGEGKFYKVKMRS